MAVSYLLLLARWTIPTRIDRGSVSWFQQKVQDWLECLALFVSGPCIAMQTQRVARDGAQRTRPRQHTALSLDKLAVRYNSRSTTVEPCGSRLCRAAGQQWVKQRDAMHGWGSNRAGCEQAMSDEEATTGRRITNFNHESNFTM